ncbi:RNA-binding S4 domain-containing protein [Hazenella sp. IB182357]|uniref:RQC P-site tRNA stabilizing factor n=1 Tax=Polycladospora coralii TaxID=2771432 RepID=A0A926N959_9BACL|nr:RNA-binding S4 domain-containing protein [Polycladospora coralii]MBD1372456.1 RNA-binding S4 domain-containing protein [Polycladospora coralii]
MRLDKFLKVSRLVKRRTLAKEVCDKGRVTINDKEAKAGTNVAVGDELTIRFGNKAVTVRVEGLKETAKKDEASDLYKLVKEEKLQSEVEQSF